MVTDNASNMRAAGRLIQAAHKHIFSAGCAAHGADLFLSVVGRMPMVAQLLKECNMVCKFFSQKQQPQALLSAISRTTLKLICETR